MKRSPIIRYLLEALLHGLIFFAILSFFQWLFPSDSIPWRIIAIQSLLYGALMPLLNRWLRKRGK